jgi:outer membrane protein OmpA-like peptidoglycan-associated protein
MMNRKTFPHPVSSVRVATVLCLALACPATWALQGFPEHVALPKDVVPYDVPSIVSEAFAEVEFPLAEGKTVAKQGRHVRSYTKWPDADYKPAAATWAQWLPALKATGWQLVGNDGGSTYTLKRAAGGTESWLRVALSDTNQPLLDLIEVAAARATLVLPAPAARPETIGDGDDFPYLRKPEGARLAGTGRVNEPLDVSMPGDREPLLAGQSYHVKRYAPPPSLSKLDFETQYRAALEKAGWKVRPLPAGQKPGEGRVVAQYAANGRQIWVELGRGNDDSDNGLSFKGADLGAEDWGATLDKQCKLPLYGVQFDFDKATLRPDSTPVLDKAAAVLKARPALKVAVLGHTDNVGTDAHNQALSAARAQSVRQWLAEHGIEPARLSSQGFGKTQPVADNATDAGRARNRRVELAREGCGR